MAKCGNCQAKLSCGCQRRTASDGKSCCSKCVKLYEHNLKNKSTPAPVPPKSTNLAGKINSVTFKWDK